MATRRRGVKNSHNKTRTTSKELLRKTTYKNKKSKHHKTKKVYQSGGGPKPKPKPKGKYKGKQGIEAEPKTIRYLINQEVVPPETLQRYFDFNKLNPTAEFDIPIEVSSLPYNISVKSVKQKTPGQKVFPILCGDARRFLGQVGLGKEGYHMVIAVRKKHPTKLNKRQIAASEIDLRRAKHIIFGKVSDDEIKQIVERVNKITTAYYQDSISGKQEIDEFNAYLESKGSKMRLVPRKENLEKSRSARVQTSFNFNPESPRTRALIEKSFMMSSQDTSPEDTSTSNRNSAMSTGATATGSIDQKLPSNSRATSRSMAPSSRGATSRGTSSRNTSSGRGISKQPTPSVSYFRKFTPRVRGKTPLPVITEEFTPE